MHELAQRSHGSRSQPARINTNVTPRWSNQTYMINVAEISDPGAIGDPSELDLLLPILGSETNTILMEDRDDVEVQHLTATAVEFTTAGRTAFRDRKVKIDLCVSYARFALACSRYDKGGGWNFWGGGGALALDAAFNAVSKTRAKLRSRGMMLVGQVRYPWIQPVGSSPKTGWASVEKLVLESSAGKNPAMRITLTLPKIIDSGRVACEITRRTARYRLASEELNPDARAGLERLATAEADGASAPDSTGMRFLNFPAAKTVSDESARLAPSRAGQHR